MSSEVTRKRDTMSKAPRRTTVDDRPPDHPAAGSADVGAEIASAFPAPVTTSAQSTNHAHNNTALKRFVRALAHATARRDWAREVGKIDEGKVTGTHEIKSVKQD